MDNFLIGSVTGAVCLDKRRPKLIGDKACYPVKARVTFERKRLYISLGFDMTEEDFSKLEKTKNSSLINVKKLIAASFERIKETVEEIHKNEEYSHDALKKKIGKGRRAYLDAAFDNRISELNKQGRVGTAASYESAKNFILKFRKGIKLTHITPSWLEKFEAWALNEEKLSITSLGIYLRTLRALLNDAIRNGDLQRASYPFHSLDKTGYKIPKGEGTKIALTIEQIEKIAKLDLTGSVQRCRDMFLLSFYLGGINFKDLLLLKWKNIANGEVHFVREKTRHTMRSSRSIKVPLIEPAGRIIEKWGNTDKSPDAFVIKHLSGDMTPQKQRDSIKSFTKQVNDQLKEIGKRDDIKIDGLSSMVARHSFATILKNSGAPIAFIGETLGHTSTQTTESYLKSFESEQRRKQFDVIANIGSKEDN